MSDNSFFFIALLGHYLDNAFKLKCLSKTYSSIEYMLPSTPHHILTTVLSNHSISSSSKLKPSNMKLPDQRHTAPWAEAPCERQQPTHHHAHLHSSRETFSPQLSLADIIFINVCLFECAAQRSRQMSDDVIGR